MIEVGARYVFTYHGGSPDSLLNPRSGEVVEVLNQTSIEGMWKVQFSDGFTHMAWGFELEPAPGIPITAASIEAEDQIAYDSDDDQLVDFEIKVEVRPLVEYRIAHAELEGLRALANTLHAMSSELEGAGYPNKIYQGAARLSEMIGRISGRRA